MIGAKCRFDTDIMFTKRYGTIISQYPLDKNKFVIKVESEDNLSFMCISGVGDYLTNKSQLIEKYGNVRIAVREKKYIEIAKYFPNLDIFKKLYPKGELMNNYWVVL